MFQAIVNFEYIPVALKYMRKGLGIFFENCEKTAATWLVQLQKEHHQCRNTGEMCTINILVNLGLNCIQADRHERV